MTVNSLVRTSLDALAMRGATFDILRSSVDLETFLVFIGYIIDALAENLLGLSYVRLHDVPKLLLAAPKLTITQSDAPEKNERH